MATLAELGDPFKITLDKSSYGCTVQATVVVGDKNLNILKEKQSSQRLINEIWSVAHELGFQKYFLNETKYSIIDDHVPFLEAGIPAIDIIDIEYRYWHTSYDTADHVSPVSLSIVGSTLQVWIGRQRQ